MKEDKKFKIILLVLLFVGYAIFLLHPLEAINQDLGRHFKISEEILSNKEIPKTNLFSYTEPNQTFINTHWLGGLIFYGLEKVVGLKGLILFKTLISLISFGIIFWLALKMSYTKNKKNFYLVFLLSFLSLFLMLERTDVRPEIFSFLFFALYFYILRTYREGSRIIYFLPLIQLLWVNIHIYFFLGPVLWLCFLIERWLKDKNYLEKGKIFGIALLTAGIIFINPNTWFGAFNPLFVLKEYGYSVVENQNVFFLFRFGYHLEILVTFILSVFLLFLSFYLNRKKFRIFDLLLAIFLSYFGFFAVRNFPIFALGILPILVFNFSSFYFQLKNYLSSLDFNWSGWLKFGLIGSLVFLCGFNLNKVDLNTKARAEDAVNFLLDNNLQGNIFNNYDVGGYLIYRLYPERKVFVDNRPEAYSVSFLQDTYIPMQTNYQIWKDKIEMYNINIIFFQYIDMTNWAIDFSNRIIKDLEWKMIYVDDNEMILIKNIEENKKIIEKYAK